MDLAYTPRQKAFREEVRAWLAANLPAEPLLSYDTREGFEQHRAWERKLFDARLSMVIWPAPAMADSAWPWPRSGAPSTA